MINPRQSKYPCGTKSTGRAFQTQTSCKAHSAKGCVWDNTRAAPQKKCYMPSNITDARSRCSLTIYIKSRLAKSGNLDVWTAHTQRLISNDFGYFKTSGHRECATATPDAGVEKDYVEKAVLKATYLMILTRPASYLVSGSTYHSTSVPLVRQELCGFLLAFDKKVGQSKTPTFYIDLVCSSLQQTKTLLYFAEIFAGYFLKIPHIALCAATTDLIKYYKKFGYFREFNACDPQQTPPSHEAMKRWDEAKTRCNEGDIYWMTKCINAYTQAQSVPTLVDQFNLVNRERGVFVDDQKVWPGIWEVIKQVEQAVAYDSGLSDPGFYDADFVARLGRIGRCPFQEESSWPYNCCPASGCAQRTAGGWPRKDRCPRCGNKSSKHHRLHRHCGSRKRSAFAERQFQKKVPHLHAPCT